MTTGLFIILSFVLSATIGAILIPRIVLMAKKKRLFDYIDDRTVHKGSISRLGGVSFYPAIIISFIITMAVAYIFWPELITHSLCPVLYANFAFFFAGTLLIFVTGLYDDLADISYKHKFISQLVAATMIVLPVSGSDNLFGFFGIYGIHPVLFSVLMIILVVFLINAYNLIDGVDGLCSSISILSFAAFIYLFGRRGDIFIPTLAAGSIGALLVFMRHNIFGKRMKIFMGDSGSMFLGYLIAFMTINYIASGSVIINFERSSEVFAVAFGVVFVPAFDAIRLFLTRLLRKKSPFQADNNHIHHKFLSLGFNHLASSLFIMLFHAAIIVLNISLVHNFHGIATYIVLADIALGMLVITTLNRLIVRKNKRETTMLISNKSPKSEH